MRFSVIIPLYNKAPYIRRALESVLAQTYTDYELIIVDDGSTDGSFTIAKQFIDERLKIKGTEDEVKGYRLKVKGKENSGAETNGYKLSPINYKLIRQANSGVSAARNAGVAQAQGEYLAFLDADDWWEPTYLERMAQLIEDYPDAGLYACNYVYYKPGKTHAALKNIETGYFNYPKAYYEGNAMPVWTGAAMIPRQVYDEMGGFPLGIKLGEDFLLWSKIALRYPVAFLNEALAWYNNDVPATLRATRNLHAPEHHMLFRLELACGYEEECKVESVKCKGKEDRKAHIPASTPYTLHLTPNSDSDHAFTPYTLHLTPTKADWKSLLDKLRVNGLLEYWLDKRYHDLAADELKKVDWSKQSDSVKQMYMAPIWLLKAKRMVMQVGSFMKQKMIKMLIIR